MTGLPTARTMLRQDAWLCLLVWCKACHHQAPADLQAIIEAGQGDRPLEDLKFRCTKCRSSLASRQRRDGAGRAGRAATRRCRAREQLYRQSNKELPHVGGVIARMRVARFIKIANPAD